MDFDGCSKKSSLFYFFAKTYHIYSQLDRVYYLKNDPKDLTHSCVNLLLEWVFPSKTVQNI